MNSVVYQAQPNLVQIKQEHSKAVKRNANAVAHTADALDVLVIPLNQYLPLQESQKVQVLIGGTYVRIKSL